MAATLVNLHLCTLLLFQWQFINSSSFLWFRTIANNIHTKAPNLPKCHNHKKYLTACVPASCLFKCFFFVILMFAYYLFFSVLVEFVEIKD